MIILSIDSAQRQARGRRNRAELIESTNLWRRSCGGVPLGIEPRHAITKTRHFVGAHPVFHFFIFCFFYMIKIFFFSFFVFMGGSLSISLPT